VKMCIRWPPALTKALQMEIGRCRRKSGMLRNLSCKFLLSQPASFRSCAPPQLGPSNENTHACCHPARDHRARPSSKLWQTPCMVGLGGKERALGQAAVAKINSNIKNTVSEMKRLIGRRWDEADLQVIACVVCHTVERRADLTFVWLM
jgi:hypothetical protein